jgi:DNA-binding transcriptional regulator YiaG
MFTFDDSLCYHRLDDDHDDDRYPRKYTDTERVRILAKCRSTGSETPWAYHERRQRLRAEHDLKQLNLEDEQPTIVKPTHSFKIVFMKSRTAMKLTQKALAQRLNVTVSEIQNYESGKVKMPGHIRGRANRVLKTKLPQ